MMTLNTNSNKKLLFKQQQLETDYIEYNQNLKSKISRTKSLNSSDFSKSLNTFNETDLLKFKIYEEEKIKEALEESYNELLNTSQELEKRIYLIDEESNEWKTRFENQEEVNRLLIKQLELIDFKINELREKLKSMKNRTQKRDDKPDANIQSLEKEKQTLVNQLRDYEWRIEQENKGYHKANEERKSLNQEIIDTRNAINAIKERQDLVNYQTATISMAINAANNVNNNAAKNNNSECRESTSRMSVTDYYYSNIPMDKRVIDPRKGPINKNAAVRLLPKLDA